jgi:hypothetical protein
MESVKTNLTEAALALKAEGRPPTAVDLLLAIKRYKTFAATLPSSISLVAPLKLSAKRYGSSGSAKPTIWKCLKEMYSWANVARNLPAYKTNQLLESYAANLESGSYLVAAMAARAIIETVAFANLECGESLKMAEPVLRIVPSMFNKRRNGIEERHHSANPRSH